MIPKADDSDFSRRKKRVALGVSLLRLYCPMRLTVEFQRKPRLHAVKIQKIRSARVLPPKLEIRKPPIAQNFPEPSLREIAPASETARKLSCPRRAIPNRSCLLFSHSRNVLGAQSAPSLSLSQQGRGLGEGL